MKYSLLYRLRESIPTCFQSVLWPFLVAGVLLYLSGALTHNRAHAAEVHYSGRLSPKDYLFGSQEKHSDSLFDNSKPIDLSASIGVGSDCGKMNFQATLQSSLQNMLDSKYFASVGMSLIGSAPMLLLCYLSPTWCAITKHFQVNANFLSHLRLNQCALIDKYVDSRVEDYYHERQSCVHRSIADHGGNMDAAMEGCQGNDVWNQSLTNWAGTQFGDKVSSNHLLESSAQWAGLTGGGGTNEALDLLKSLVGDTVVGKGGITVEYGPRKSPLTPRTYLQSLEKTTQDKLCDKILRKIQARGEQVSVDQIVSDADLKDLNQYSDQLLIDRQTLRALASMNPAQQERACKKLSEAVAMTVFSNDVNRSLDVLTTLAQNPNLPPQRKQEIEEKRKALKEQIELTVELQKQRSEPLNQVLAKIHEEGNLRQGEAVSEGLNTDADTEGNQRSEINYFDCSDSVMCNH